MMEMLLGAANDANSVHEEDERGLVLWSKHPAKTRVLLKVLLSLRGH